MKKPLLIGLLTLTVLAAPALAQLLKGHNVNAPVDVSAEHTEVLDRENRAIFSGNVHVVQEGLTLNAARLTVAYHKSGTGSPEMDRFDAQGGVSLTSPTQNAHSEVAIYDLNRKLITMIGGVDLQQGSNTVHGARLTVDLVSGRSVMDGGAVSGNADAPGASNGRVTGHFSVPQRQP